MAQKSSSASSQTGYKRTEQAQAETLETLSARLVKIETLAEKQESRNQTVLYAVLMAAVFIVVTVAVEVIISRGQDGSDMNNFYSQMATIKQQQNSLQEEYDMLKARNPYLK
jgi:hypothetical protein